MDYYQFVSDQSASRKWIKPGMLPCECMDRHRRTIIIEPNREEYYGELSEMYDSFMPKAVAHGIPPENKDIRQKWLDDVLHAGTNLLARVDGRIVGHSVLAPIPPGDRAEFGIFIHQDYQNRSIGTNLTCVTICCALKARFRSLWLCVDPRNMHAVALYRLVGFVYTEKDGVEGCMELDLARLSA